MTRLARTFSATSRASSPPWTSAARQVRALFPEERPSVRIEGVIRSRKTRCVDRESDSQHVLRRPRGVLLLPERPQHRRACRPTRGRGRRRGEKGAGALPPGRVAFVHALVRPAPPPPSRTHWTRLVPPPVLTGHVSSPRSVAYAMLRLRLPLPDALARVRAVAEERQGVVASATNVSG